MRITVVGTGYVGLVTGTCFAEMGNKVICVDQDITKVEGLKNGIIPIFEPGLKPMVIESFKKGVLSFTISLEDALAETDIVNIDRVSHILNKNRDGFIKRVLTEHETALFTNKADNAAYCAKRFAAKEAFAKALGTGIGKVVSFQDLTVRSNENGKPYFIPSEKLRQYLIEKNITKAHLSISDETKNAIAFVILELENIDS